MLMMMRWWLLRSYTCRTWRRSSTNCLILIPSFSPSQPMWRRIALFWMTSSFRAQAKLSCCGHGSMATSSRLSSLQEVRATSQLLCASFVFTCSSKRTCLFHEDRKCVCGFDDDLPVWLVSQAAKKTTTPFSQACVSSARVNCCCKWALTC